MAQLSKAKRADNVTVLPTAAARKIDNRRYAGQRDASLAARKAAPWPGVFRFPSERARDAENRALAGASRTPELLILMSIMEAMAPDDRQRLAAKVQSYAAVIGDDTSAAAAVITRRLATGSPIATGKEGAL